MLIILRTWLVKQIGALNGAIVHLIIKAGNFSYRVADFLFDLQGNHFFKTDDEIIYFIIFPPLIHLEFCSLDINVYTCMQ